MRIEDLESGHAERIEAVAQMLVESFADFSPGWLPSLDKAREEVLESFEPGRLSRVSLSESGEVAGWVGGGHCYGRLWELHPLVVSPRHGHQGHGRALVADLAARVKERGALTLYASTSDECDRTTLFGKDLHGDPIAALRDLRTTREHPLDFFLRVGFSLVGLMPDAEGPGKPSIELAMPLGPRSGKS